MSDPNNHPRPSPLGWRVAQVWAVLALGLVVLGLARLQLDRTPLVATGRANLESLRPFWVASASAWAALTMMWWMLARRRVVIRIRYTLTSSDDPSSDALKNDDLVLENMQRSLDST